MSEMQNPIVIRGTKCWSLRKAVRVRKRNSLIPPELEENRTVPRKNGRGERKEHLHPTKGYRGG